MFKLVAWWNNGPCDGKHLECITLTTNKSSTFQINNIKVYVLYTTKNYYSIKLYWSNNFPITVLLLCLRQSKKLILPLCPLLALRPTNLNFNLPLKLFYPAQLLFWDPHFTIQIYITVRVSYGNIKV